MRLEVSLIVRICESEGKATAVDGFAVQGPVREVRYSCSASSKKVLFVMRASGVGTLWFWY